MVQSINDFMAGVNISNQTYHMGINIDRTIRRFLAEVLDKGIVYETWGIKSYWVIQEYIYANLVKRYGLKQEGFSTEDASRFALQDFTPNGDMIKLQTTRYVSVSVDEIYQVMRNDSGLPSKTRFIAALNDRLKRTIELGIRNKIRLKL